MKRTTFLAAGAGACALALALSRTSSAVQSVAPAPGLGPVLGAGCTNAIEQEIVLAYDLSGSTLIGLFHTSLVVYANGYCSISKRDQVVFPAPGIDVDVQTKSVGQAAVAELLNKLLLAGAATQCDQQSIVFDVPLKTVSLAGGFTNARVHTFSYWLDSSGVDSAIQGFIQQHFPGF